MLCFAFKSEIKLKVEDEEVLSRKQIYVPSNCQDIYKTCPNGPVGITFVSEECSLKVSKKCTGKPGDEQHIYKGGVSCGVGGYWERGVPAT